VAAKLWAVHYGSETYVVSGETGRALRKLLDRGGHDTFTFTPEGQDSPVTINIGPSVAIALEEADAVERQQAG